MAYSHPHEVWEAPSGVKIDPRDSAYDEASIGGDPVGPDGAPIVYLFSNAISGDGVAYAMAEDGTVLASHLCSHWGYMKHDLHDYREDGKRMRDHYPDGYRIQILGPGQKVPDHVYELNQQARHDAEATEENK